MAGYLRREVSDPDNITTPIVLFIPLVSHPPMESTSMPHGGDIEGSFQMGSKKDFSKIAAVILTELFPKEKPSESKNQVLVLSHVLTNFFLS